MDRLTDREWKVMEALWQGGPQTLGEVLARLAEDTGWSRTTVHTYLTRMMAKDLVTADTQSPRRYSAGPLPGALCGGGGALPGRPGLRRLGGAAGGSLRALRPAGPGGAGGAAPPSGRDGGVAGGKYLDASSADGGGRAVRPLSPSAPADLPKSALPPVAVRNLGGAGPETADPRGGVGPVHRSGCVALAGGRPGWGRADSGLRVQLPLDTLPPPRPHPPSPSGGPPVPHRLAVPPLSGRGAGPGPVVPGVRPAPVPPGLPGRPGGGPPAGGHRRCGPTVPAAPPPARGGVPLGAKPLPDGIFCSRSGPAYGLGAGRKGHPA